ncbi:hypothetical protein [Rhodoferax saidenbachensis]|uniref:Outer membrane biosynthesis protein TonB n=1 Tax=Rhodoferax saidenbachensis TaxID=1484693 RepID=A0ABU1ZM93_9BURK|nr:hypothetical protein [Rhodoferax saidenbachensis]MDR7306654.1 outer membrane biosynthesis protein TonB [Rhodoferax saidenbachensis]
MTTADNATGAETQAPAKTSAKAPAKTVAKTTTKAPAKAVTKPAAKTPAKAKAVAAKKSVAAVQKPAPKAAAAKPAKPVKVVAKKPVAKPVAAPVAKVKKPKMVRDSITIPKPEYDVLTVLKLRAAKQGTPAKKTELIRAGIKVLAALSDTAFKAALQAVPSLKTGRPAKAKKA